MDRTARYRDVIESVMTEYASIQYSYGQIERIVAFDRQRDNYLLFSTGWNRGRVHGCILHTA